MSFIRQDMDSTSWSADFRNYIDDQTRTQMADISTTISSRLVNETQGGRFEVAFVSNEVLRIIRPVLQAMKGAKSEKVVNEVKILISLITNILIRLQHHNFDIGKLPSLNAVNLEDNSLLIEWIFQTFRIGFVVETKKEDSGWYLVSTIEKTDFNEFGRLIDSDKENLVNRLVSFLISYI